MKQKYPEYKQLNLTEIADEMLLSWDQENAFEKSISNRKGSIPFVFYEGPPSANGMPGIHHVISRTLKDLVCRYKTMQGFQVKRKGGWDTHGLPVELGVEKLLGITKEDIGKKISVEEYNATCRREVLKFKDKWDELTKKMGYWVDLKHPYITFENNYIETLWWCLKELYKKGFLYESVSIQPYSPAAGTGLSSHELNQPGTYKDVKDTSVTAMFKAITNKKSAFLFEAAKSDEIFFLAWTTTPWTLPSNLGLTVGPNIDYVLVKTFNPYTHLPIDVVLAKALLAKYFDMNLEDENGDVVNISNLIRTQWDDNPTHLSKGKIFNWEILVEFKGEALKGFEYEQLMPSNANTLEKITEITPGAQPFKVVVGDFVTTEDGTGIVHTSPAFGADDYKVGQKNNLGILTLVDKEGKFINGVGEFSGRFVKNYKDDPHYEDVNVDISVKLKKENRAFKVEKYEHTYPHCWRTDKPIIYYPLDAWFIKTTAVKDRMIELNNTINWKPASTGTGRFGNWLENMVDWNLSRSRFWGTPLPVWKCGETEPDLTEEDTTYRSPLDRSFFDKNRFEKAYDQICVGSKTELIEVIAKGGDKCKGFLVDFNKLTKDILEDNAQIIQKIQKNNLRFPRNSYNYISIEDLKESFVKKQGFTKDLLIKFRFSLQIIEDYIIEINEKNCVELDLHKPFIDNIVFSRNGSLDDENLYIRVDDLIDVWFDSGAMPYAQWHFPFENKEIFALNYPADFIAEGVDQTRGWFYTLHALGSLLKESVEEELQKANLPTNNVDGKAYKTVISNGLVLDKNGNKMSKRIGNVIDPFETLEIFGPDATRWYLITNASPWDNSKFDIEGIKEVQRKFFGTLYNTYQFFALYANVDGFYFEEKIIPANERPEIDQWIISCLNTLIKDVTKNLDGYEPTQAGRAIESFVDEQLSNWYVRLCRRRFWKPVRKKSDGNPNESEDKKDKISAYQTLYECLQAVSGLIAPIAPFFADWLFKNLNSVTKKLKAESIHLSDFPKSAENLINSDLEERMRLAQDISSLILSLRKKVNIKVRQPLQKVIIPAIDNSFEQKIKLVEDIIKSETNIKEVEVIPANNDFIRKKAKANFKTLGKKLGAKMKWAAEKIQNLNDEQIDKLLKSDFILNPDFKENNEEAVYISSEDIELSTNEITGFEIAVKGQVTVALDLEITLTLKNEGFAREFINRIQNIRKESNLEITDKIQLIIKDKDNVKAVINEYNHYICAEILAEEIHFEKEVLNGINIEVNNDNLTVKVTKKGN
ncbi:MAG: isoleucine--tRNA ligase [Bacteroidota bacterium]|nr:isoleucine--tRNA ligase [Bacteroidota bacterium]